MFWANSKPKNFLNLLSGETKIYILSKTKQKEIVVLVHSYNRYVGFNQNDDGF